MEIIILIVGVCNIGLLLFLIFKPKEKSLEVKNLDDKLSETLYNLGVQVSKNETEQKVLFEKMNSFVETRFSTFTISNNNVLNNLSSNIKEVVSLNTAKQEKSFYDFSQIITANINELSSSLKKNLGDNSLKQEKSNSELTRSLIMNINDFSSSFIAVIKENTINQEKSFREFATNFMKSLNEDFEKLNSQVESRLMVVSNVVNERLDQNFEKSNGTFLNIIERLSKIDEAQKKIDNLSMNIVSLQDILKDKKSRGTFGEIQLSNIFEAIFGEDSKLYETQYTLSNKSVVDLILKTPEPLGNICVDSKFPLENYQRMVDNTLSSVDKNIFAKAFEKDLKKHIDDIASKYIIEGETANQALMFIPAESIFATIHGSHPDIIAYSQKRKVWLASPTTLFAQLTTIQVVLRDMERSKYANVIHEHLIKLEQEFSRYSERWSNLNKRIDSLSKDAKDVNVTSVKISNEFENIRNSNILKLED